MAPGGNVTSRIGFGTVFSRIWFSQFDSIQNPDAGIHPECLHYEGQAWHIELDRPEQGFQSIGSRAVMGKELLCQIAVLELQAGGISEELSN